MSAPPAHQRTKEAPPAMVLAEGAARSEDRANGKPLSCAILRLIWSCMRPGSVLGFCVRTRRPDAVIPTACRESRRLLRADSRFVKHKPRRPAVTGPCEALTMLDFASKARARNDITPTGGIDRLRPPSQERPEAATECRFRAPARKARSAMQRPAPFVGHRIASRNGVAVIHARPAPPRAIPSRWNRRIRTRFDANFIVHDISAGQIRGR